MSYEDFKKQHEAGIQKTKDLAEKFAERWPEFFRDVYCGFFLPADWESLVWALCETIEFSLERAGLPLDSVQVAQVKEKFWGLRFYYDTSDDVCELVRARIEGAVSFAEGLSFRGEYDIRPRPAR